MPISLEFPSNLPLPLVALSNRNSINSAQGDPNVGPPATYKWSDQEYLTFELTWSMEQDQLTNFLEFFNTSLKFGSRWFLMSMQWAVDTAGDTRKLECNFNGIKPNYTTLGKRRRITSSVIVRNPYRDNREFYDYYINLIAVENLENVIDRLELFANSDLPGDLPS